MLRKERQRGGDLEVYRTNSLGYEQHWCRPGFCKDIRVQCMRLGAKLNHVANQHQCLQMVYDASPPRTRSDLDIAHDCLTISIDIQSD